MNKQTVLLNDNFSIDDVVAIAENNANIHLEPDVVERMQASANLLDEFVSQRKLIYGVTTGFGPLAESYIDPDNAESLQRNLIYHLCAGVGPLYPREQVRAIMAARIATLSRGWSGIAPDVVHLLTAMLENDIIPAVPQMGTVGASGDLTPLAHIALAAIGEGEVYAKDDANDVEQTISSATALQNAGLEPLRLRRKEGLALVNGTAAMTGVAALNGASFARAIELAERLTVMYGEVSGARAEAWHQRIAAARPHQGQIESSQSLNRFANGSDRIDFTLSAQKTLPPMNAVGVLQQQTLPQDAYTLRCAPQEFGAARDVLRFHNSTVEQELNSTTDNPLVDCETGMVYHGGNFFGQHVAYASDSLMLAVIKLAVHAERVIARITDTKQNGDLPPFLTGSGQAGLHSGFMGAQVTASAIVAEMRSKAVPASIQSIPTNANNQDVVTMGTIAARRSADLLSMLWKVLSIESLVLAQAAELQSNGDLKDYSTSSNDLWRQVREISAPLTEDRPLSKEIELLARELCKPNAEQSQNETSARNAA